MLRSTLAPLADSIALAFVYGSVARGEEKSDSDIDLMVIGKVSLEDVVGKLSSVEASLRRAVNPTLFSPSEFKRKLASANHFLNSVVRGDKIFLIGDEDELRKVGGIRLAQNGTDKSRGD
jgi:predicted nucleotidyltransferase